MSTTLADVRGAFKRARAAGIAAGIPQAESWTLQEGSQTNGLAWRLFAEGVHGSLGSPMPGFDGLGYIGWTRTEAYLSLRMIAQTLEAVTIMREREA